MSGWARPFVLGRSTSRTAPRRMHGRVLCGLVAQPVRSELCGLYWHALCATGDVRAVQGVLTRQPPMGRPLGAILDGGKQPVRSALCELYCRPARWQGGKTQTGKAWHGGAPHVEAGSRGRALQTLMQGRRKTWQVQSTVEHAARGSSQSGAGIANFTARLSSGSLRGRRHETQPHLASRAVVERTKSPGPGRHAVCTEATACARLPATLVYKALGSQDRNRDAESRAGRPVCIALQNRPRAIATSPPIDLLTTVHTPRSPQPT